MSEKAERKALIAALRQNAETRQDVHGLVAVKPDVLTDAADEIERLERHIENMRRET